MRSDPRSDGPIQGEREEERIADVKRVRQEERNPVRELVDLIEVRAPGLKPLMAEVLNWSVPATISHEPKLDRAPGRVARCRLPRQRCRSPAPGSQRRGA
jgi:hypothetical protein